MLVLTRKVGEKIWINDDICITVLETAYGRVRLGLEAPQEVRIFREEIKLQIDADKVAVTKGPLPVVDTPILAPSG